jgi:hypothetical protein
VSGEYASGLHDLFLIFQRNDHAWIPVGLRLHHLSYTLRFLRTCETAVAVPMRMGSA